MAIFGSKRDASFINRINKELINEVIDTLVGYYKFAPEDTKTNLYGESDSKAYYYPVKLSCLIQRSNQEFDSEEAGSDLKQPAVFSFLRRNLHDINLLPEIGDIVEWDDEYYEIDSIRKNQYWGGKNPDAGLEDDSHGYNVSIICEAHHTRKTLTNIIDPRSGNNPLNYGPGDE